MLLGVLPGAVLVLGLLTSVRPLQAFGMAASAPNPSMGVFGGGFGRGLVTYDPVGNKLFETDVARLRTEFDYDGLYRVKEKRLPETNPTTSQPYRELYGYDKVGNRTSFTDANGKVTTSEYDGLNRLVRAVRDPLGLGLESTVLYSDPEGSKVNKTEEHDVQKGLRTLYAYDALNRETLRTVKLEGQDGDSIDPPEYVTATTYDDGNHAMTVVDPRGTEVFRRMNGRDLLVEEVVDAGSSGLRLRTTMAYDGLGNRRRVTDPRGHSTLYGYDGLGRLRTTSDALRQDTTYEHDGEGLKTTETDRRGVKRRFTYDNLGRPLRTELLASITGVPSSREVEYRDQDLKRIETDARGLKTTYDLDKLGRVVRVTDPDGKLKTLAYDGVNKVSESDKRGNVTLFVYDATNRLVKVTDPVPLQLQTVTTTYDDAANRVTEKDRRGKLRVTQLDPLGRTRSVTRAGVVLERHEYDGNGNRLRSLDADNRETRFNYDPANRLSARTDGFGTPAAATTTFQYDLSSNPTEERDSRAAALGEPFSIRRTYDELNRLTSMVDGEAQVTRYSYDPEGNRTSVVEPKGQATASEYDELGKLTKVTQAEVQVAGGGVSSPATRYEYDKSRNRIRQVDANGHVVEMAYDKLNRMTTMTQDPVGLELVTQHEYDPNGNETKLTDPKGQNVTNTYDELNRLKTKAYAFAPADPVRPWRHTTGLTYGYDPNNNPVQVDESVASGTDPPGPPFVTTRSYDDLDRLTSETTTLPDGGTKQVAYTYFANGTRQTVTDPEDLVSSFQYDGQNRLQSMTTAFGTPEARTTGYSYFGDDLLHEVSYPNGIKATHQYDLADRLTSLTNAKPAQPPTSAYGYEYDANGNRTKQIETNGLPTPTVEMTTYSYDALNRLASVTYPDKKVGYGYDLVGNRTSEIEKDLADVVLSNKVASFDAVNRLESLTDSVAPTNDMTFTYDKNGNQLTKTTDGTTTEHRYDVRDKLVEVAQGASILSRFQYDFQSRRSKKIGEGLAGDQIRQYVYDQTSLLAEYNVAGAQVAKYDYGSDRLISLFRFDGEGRRYFHLDGLRSVVNLTDDGGTAQASYHLDSWGNFRFPSELDSSKNRFAFTGHLWDPETELYFAKARYLDPEIGRFVSQDSFLGSIDEPPSLHRFTYAANRPTFFVDPTGHRYRPPQGQPDAGAFVDDVIMTGWGYGKGGVKAVGQGLAGTVLTLARGTQNLQKERYRIPGLEPLGRQDVDAVAQEAKFYAKTLGNLSTTAPAALDAITELGVEKSGEALGSTYTSAALTIEGGRALATGGVRALRAAPGEFAEVGRNLSGMLRGAPEAVVVLEAGAAGPVALPQAAANLRLTPQQIAQARAALLDAGELSVGGGSQGALEAAPKTAAANGRTYITYELKNAQGEVVYVGRASGVGTPEQVMQGRLARGHDVFDANPGLRAEVKVGQGSPAANKGAEGVLYEQRLREGAKLLNDPKSPPLSSKPKKAAEVGAKVEAYHEDLKQP